MHANSKEKSTRLIAFAVSHYCQDLRNWHSAIATL